MSLPGIRSLCCLFWLTAPVVFCHAQSADVQVIRLSEISLSEFSRQVVQTDGHKVTLIRVRPPVLAEPPSVQAKPMREPSPAELAAMQASEQKRHVSLAITATVYLRHGRPPVSELRWHDADGKVAYRAWSNVDFRYLSQLYYLETEEVVYSWFPFVEAWDLAELPADYPSPIPAELIFPNKGSAEYLIDIRASAAEAEKDVLAGLDYLHAYYQLNFARLKKTHEKLWADHAAREKELRENPPRKPDTVIHFWPIKTGKTLLR